MVDVPLADTVGNNGRQISTNDGGIPLSTLLVLLLRATGGKERGIQLFSHLCKSMKIERVKVHCP